MREGDFLEFARANAPGARCVYGRGVIPPADAVRAMADLVEARVLVPVRKREGAEFLFMVERGSAPLGRVGARVRASRGQVRKRVIRKTSLSMVFDMLVRAARRGMPCPTNDELATACHLSGKLDASYRMRRLVQAGKIAVEDHSPYGRRIVTILTGVHAGRQTVMGGI